LHRTFGRDAAPYSAKLLPREAIKKRRPAEYFYSTGPFA
jgi:hypothetical protein